MTELRESRAARRAVLPGFRWLWAAYSINVVGDELFLLAVPLIAYQLGGSASTMAWLLALSLLPQALFGVLGGVVADRVQRVALLRVCSALSGLVLLVMFLQLRVAPQLGLAGLAVGVVVLGLFASMSASAFDSVITEFVAPERLARAHSATEASRTVAVLLGPAAAGLLVAHLSPSSAVLANGFSFAVAVLLLTRLRTAKVSHTTVTWKLNHVLAELRVGLRYVIVENSTIRTGIMLSTAGNLVLGAYEPMLIFRLRDDMRVGASQVGFIFGIAGGAAAVVALLLAWKAPARSHGAIMASAMTVQGAAVLVTGTSSQAVLVLLAHAIFAVGLVVYTIYWRALRQLLCPADLVGRMAGACRAIAYLGWFVGSAISATLLAQGQSVMTVLSAAGIMVIVFGVSGYLVLRKQVKS